MTGPKGTGKTTFLYHLARILEEQGFEATILTAGKQRPLKIIKAAASGGPGSALLVDSAEKLSLPAWLALRAASRNPGVFVVSTHTRFRMPVLLETQTTPELLFELAGRLTSDRQVINPEETEILFERFSGNLRSAFRHLYDCCAQARD